MSEKEKFFDNSKSNQMIQKPSKSHNYRRSIVLFTYFAATAVFAEATGSAFSEAMISMWQGEAM
jgi:hypothetical protein